MSRFDAGETFEKLKGRRNRCKNPQGFADPRGKLQRLLGKSKTI